MMWDFVSIIRLLSHMSYSCLFTRLKIKYGIFKRSKMFGHTDFYYD